MRKVIAEKSLKHFIVQAWSILERKKPLIWNWHLDAICMHLEAITNTYIVKSGLHGQTVDGFTYQGNPNLPFINYLNINMPPRHSKSLITSVFWPCWEWGPQNLPEMRYLCLSYAAPLSTRDSLKRRRLIESRWYQENWGDRFQLTGDENQKTRFSNDHTGYMISSSIKGLITGEGGMRIMVDDAHNVNEVESLQKRSTVIDTWDNSLSSRCDDDTVGAYILVQQRTHKNDLSGHVLEKYARDEIPNLVHLCLPARYTSKHSHPSITPLDFKDPRTTEGEPLDKHRWPEESLKIRESRMTAWARNCQMQQDPTQKGGQIIPVGFIRLVENYNHRQVKKMVRYWDKAASEDKSASHTVGVLMALMNDDCEYGVLILDAVSGLWSVGNRDSVMKNTAQLDGIEVEQVVEQEPGSGGKESAQNSVRKVFFGFKASMDRPTGEKEVRLEPFVAQVENKNVAMLKSNWNKEYKDSLEECSSGHITDYADGTSGAFNWLSGLAGKQKSRVRVSVGKR
jgi:phage terminase large subunit-like protein